MDRCYWINDWTTRRVFFKYYTTTEQDQQRSSQIWFNHIILSTNFNEMVLNTRITPPIAYGTYTIRSTSLIAARGLTGVSLIHISSCFVPSTGNKRFRMMWCCFLVVTDNSTMSLASSWWTCFNIKVFASGDVDAIPEHAKEAWDLYANHWSCGLFSN